jgi:hypothetical protein
MPRTEQNLLEKCSELQEVIFLVLPLKFYLSITFPNKTIYLHLPRLPNKNLDSHLFITLVLVGQVHLEDALPRLLGWPVLCKMLSGSFPQFFNRFLWRCPLKHQSAAIQMGALAECLEGSFCITLRDIVHKTKTTMGTSADHFPRQTNGLQLSENPKIGHQLNNAS